MLVIFLFIYRHIKLELDFFLLLLVALHVIQCYGFTQMLILSKLWLWLFWRWYPPSTLPKWLDMLSREKSKLASVDMIKTFLVRGATGTNSIWWNFVSTHFVFLPTSMYGLCQKYKMCLILNPRFGINFSKHWLYIPFHRDRFYNLFLNTLYTYFYCCQTSQTQSLILQ